MLRTRRVPSDRATFIWRNGIVRCGIPLGAIVFLWVVVAQFSTTLDGLQTRSGWLELGLLLLICVGEWTLGGGWLIGAALWSLQHGSLAPARRHPRRCAHREGRLQR